MLTFKEFLDGLGDTEIIAQYIKRVTNRLMLLEPKEIEEAKPLLLNLKDTLADKLSGT